MKTYLILISRKLPYNLQLKIIEYCFKNKICYCVSDITDRIIEDLKPKFVIETEVIKHFKKFKEYNCQCIFFTSGSTGNPKKVLITTENIDYFRDNFIKNTNCLDYDIFIDVIDFSFIMSLYNIILKLCYNKKLVKIDLNNFSFNHKQNKERVGIILTPNSLNFLKQCKITDKLDFMLLGGDKMDNVDETLLPKNCFISYGLSESCAGLLYNKFNKENLYKIPYFDFKIEETLKVKTKQISREFIGDDGYFDTDDVFSLEGNYLKMVTRSKRRVKINGYRVDLDDLQNYFRQFDNTAVVVYEGSLFLFVDNPENITTKGLDFYKQPSFIIKQKLIINNRGKINYEEYRHRAKDYIKNIKENNE